MLWNKAAAEENKIINIFKAAFPVLSKSNFRQNIRFIEIY